MTDGVTHDWRWALLDLLTSPKGEIRLPASKAQQEDMAALLESAAKVDPDVKSYREWVTLGREGDEIICRRTEGSRPMPGPFVAEAMRLLKEQGIAVRGGAGHSG